MPKRIQVPFEGEMVPADQLDFESEKEPFCVYRLEDGTTLKIKTILANVARLVDRFKPDGQPIYVLGVGGLPVLDVPPELMRQPAQPLAKEE